MKPLLLRPSQGQGGPQPDSIFWVGELFRLRRSRYGLGKPRRLLHFLGVYAFDWLCFASDRFNADDQQIFSKKA